MSERQITHLRCTACKDTVGIVNENGTHYVVCHCTHDDGEIDRLPVSQLPFVLPSRWEYAENGVTTGELA